MEFAILIPKKGVWRDGTADFVQIFTDDPKLNGAVSGGVYLEPLVIGRSIRILFKLKFQQYKLL